MNHLVMPFASVRALAFALFLALFCLPGLAFSQPMQANGASATLSDRLTETIIATDAAETPTLVRDTKRLSLFSYWYRSNQRIATPRAARINEKNRRVPLSALLCPESAGLIGEGQRPVMHPISDLVCSRANARAFTLTCILPDHQLWRNRDFTCTPGNDVSLLALYPAHCRHRRIETNTGTMVTVPAPRPSVNDIQIEAQAVFAQDPPQLNNWQETSLGMVGLVGRLTSGVTEPLRTDIRQVFGTSLVNCDNLLNMVRRACPNLAGTIGGNSPDPLRRENDGLRTIIRAQERTYERELDIRDNKLRWAYMLLAFGLMITGAFAAWWFMRSPRHKRNDSLEFVPMPVPDVKPSPDYHQLLKEEQAARRQDADAHQAECERLNRLRIARDKEHAKELQTQAAALKDQNTKMRDAYKTLVAGLEQETKGLKANQLALTTTLSDTTARLNAALTQVTSLTTQLEQAQNTLSDARAEAIKTRDNHRSALLRQSKEHEKLQEALQSAEVRCAEAVANESDLRRQLEDAHSMIEQLGGVVASASLEAAAAKAKNPTSHAPAGLDQLIMEVPAPANPAANPPQNENHPPVVSNAQTPVVVNNDLSKEVDHAFDAAFNAQGTEAPANPAASPSSTLNAHPSIIDVPTVPSFAQPDDPTNLTNRSVALAATPEARGDRGPVGTAPAPEFDPALQDALEPEEAPRQPGERVTRDLIPQRSNPEGRTAIARVKLAERPASTYGAPIGPNSFGRPGGTPAEGIASQYPTSKGLQQMTTEQARANANNGGTARTNRKP